MPGVEAPTIFTYGNMQETVSGTTAHVANHSLPTQLVILLRESNAGLPWFNVFPGPWFTVSHRQTVAG